MVKTAQSKIGLTTLFLVIFGFIPNSDALRSRGQGAQTELSDLLDRASKRVEVFCVLVGDTGWTLRARECLGMRTRTRWNSMTRKSRWSLFADFTNMRRAVTALRSRSESSSISFLIRGGRRTARAVSAAIAGSPTNTASSSASV